MDINIYEKYAVLNAEIKELVAKKDAIKELVLADMDSNGESKVATAIGKFTVTKLKTWKYTDKVVDMNEDLKALKATEESNGEATFVEKDSLRFNQTKL